jgi:hypothetical protein
MLDQLGTLKGRLTSCVSAGAAAARERRGQRRVPRAVQAPRRFAAVLGKKRPVRFMYVR